MSTKEELDKAVESYIHAVVAAVDFQTEHGVMSPKVYGEMEAAGAKMTELGIQHFYPDRLKG